MERGLYVGMLFATLAVVPAAQACSMVGSQFLGVPPDEYIFTGKVVGYATYELDPCMPGHDPETCGASWGYRLEVLDPVQMPTPGLRHIDVFEFGNDSMCNSTPAPESAVRRYPLGTRFKVAAKALPSERVAPGTVALIVSNDAILYPVSPSTSLKEIREGRFSYTWTWLGGGGASMYEVRKDLVRIEHASSPRQASDIVKRLADFDLFSRRADREDQPADLFDELLLRWVDDDAESLAILERRAMLARWVSSEEEDHLPSAVLAFEERHPAFRVAHALELLEDNLYAEAIVWLEMAERERYLPATLHKARAWHALAEHLENLDTTLSARYEERSQALFKSLLQSVQRGAAKGDDISKLMLSALYRNGEGVEEDLEHAIDLECEVVEAPVVPLNIFGTTEPRYSPFCPRR